MYDKYIKIQIPLSLLYDFSFNFGKIPDDWKDANVTPIYKNKGSRSDITNYRDISVLCNSFKPFEHIINDFLIDFCVSRGILTPSQHAYLPGRSTVTNLLSSMCDWVNTVDQGGFVDVIYLDIKKAFNSISHAKLVTKLHGLGIRGKVLDILREILSHRRQRVKINDTVSDFSSLVSGVPQGSKLGPTLFMLFVNDLPSVVSHSKIQLYADDAKLYYCVPKNGINGFLQRDIDAVASWMEYWQLDLAISKCFAMRIGAPVVDRPYSISGAPIPFVNSCKDLGILISSNLKFHEQTGSVVNRATRMVNVILSNFVSKDPNLLLRMFNIYVLSIMSYACEVWYPGFVGDVSRLEHVQRFFTSKINGCQNLNYDERRVFLGVPSMVERFQMRDLILIYKILNGHVFLNSADYLQPMMSNYRTRGHARKLRLPVFNLTCKRFFFTNRSILLWNSLPDSVVGATSISTFKSRLESYFASRQQALM